MEMSKINLFVLLRSGKPIKLIDVKTGIYERLIPDKSESKLIHRRIMKCQKKS